VKDKPVVVRSTSRTVATSPSLEASAGRWDAGLTRERLVWVVGDEYFAIRVFTEE
jgi:hypothetical protein